MSTEGGAAVVAVPVVAVVAPAAIVAAGAVALAVGGVMLAAKGAMWCGEQLHAAYEERVNSWELGRQRVEREAMARRVSLDSLLAGEQARYHALQAQRPPDPNDANLRLMRALEAEVQRALAAIKPSHALPAADPAVIVAERALQRERGGLAAELDIARALGVDSGLIARAESARDGSLAEVRAARFALNAAWARIDDTERQRDSQRQRASANLIQAEMALAGVRALANGARVILTPQQASDIERLEGDLAVARGRLQGAPDRALEDSPAILARARALEDAAQAGDARSRIDRMSAVARARGQVTALRALVEDARTLGYAPVSTIDGWRASLDGAEAALTATEPDPGAITGTVNNVERQVFAAIASGQQRAITDQIAGVMAGQGFHDYRSAAGPAIETLADGAVRVTGVRNDAQPGMGHDDKIVTFTLSPSGSIEYDFSGYVGDACHRDMKAIFDGLRALGIIIVDKRWQAQNQGAMTYDRAMSSASAPAIVTNKKQALITAAVMEALKRMGYSDGDITVSSVGGERRINASKGGPEYYRFGVDTTGKADLGGAKTADLPRPLRDALQASESGEDEDGPGYIAGSGAVKN